MLERRGVCVLDHLSVDQRPVRFHLGHGAVVGDPVAGRRAVVHNAIARNAIVHDAIVDKAVVRRAVDGVVAGDHFYIGRRHCIAVADSDHFRRTAR
jgi:hypothetical protein